MEKNAFICKMPGQQGGNHSKIVGITDVLSFTVKIAEDCQVDE